VPVTHDCPETHGVERLFFDGETGVMAKQKVNYGQFYKVGQAVKVGVQLSNSVKREINGEVLSLEGDRVTVEILGGEMSSAFSGKKSGAGYSLSGWSGWGFFCCDAILDTVVSSKEIELRLTGSVEEKQRREYFRLDVSLPVRIEVPATQSPGAIKEQWHAFRAGALKAPPPEMFPSGKGYRAVLPGGIDIPAQPVNLSGGGLRLRRSSSIPAGDMVHVHLYLPLAPSRVINIVAEVLRCNEITLRLEKDPVMILAMKFVHIDEKDREAIISFLFSEQRIQLQSEAERENSPQTR